MDEENVYSALVGIVLGAAFGVLGTAAYMYETTTGAKREQQAIEKEFATYYEGKFIWKDDLVEQNFFKDLEFFQRNEDKMKMFPVPGMPERIDAPEKFN